MAIRRARPRRVTTRASSHPLAQIKVLEKDEQAQAVKLLQGIGAAVYVLGNRRAAPTGTCPSCGKLIFLKDRKHYTTRQTEGISDLVGFLPLRDGRRDVLFAEMKAAGGVASDAQLDFAALAKASTAHYVIGGYNAVIAFLLEQGYITERSVPHYRLPSAVRPSSEQGSTDAL